MKAVLVLANAGQADPGGTVHALNLGWSFTVTPTPAMSLVLLIDCPWDQTNSTHDILIELCDADGRPVLAPTGQGEEATPAIRIEGQFEAGRPPGTPTGSPQRQCLSIEIGPGIQLTPGQKYEFRLSVDGEPMDSWLSTFTVRA